MNSRASTAELLKTVSQKIFGIFRAAHRGLVSLWCIPVQLYRKFLSPLKGHGSCRFTPTCSRYFLDAVGEWGIFIGTTLALIRVIRCNPFSKGGHDPVPTRAETLRRIRTALTRHQRDLSVRSDAAENAGTGDPESRTEPSPEGGDDPQS